MKKIFIIAIFSCLLIISSTTLQSTENSFDELIFIDHQNLRYVEDREIIRFQVSEIKKNMDKAAEYGIDSYLFFAKETFEAMLNYDFTVDDIGHIGSQSFPVDSEHRKTGEYLREALHEVIDYAKTKNLSVFFHSNQFIFPPKVLNVIKPVVWGTAVCPGREITWEIYRQKLCEFLAIFPDIAGFQVTGDETQVSVLECTCDSCRHLSYVDRVNLLTEETAMVCEQYGKEVQMRTWQRMGELEDEKHPSEMAKDLPDNVFFSIKNTKGDFHIVHPIDEKFILSADPDRVIVEFDAWREYNGNNYFPCFMGEKWATRFKFLHKLGIKRVAVRLNWNSNKNPIFEMPWGNELNIYTFIKLAENPERTADDILRSFIRDKFPQSARKAAFELYKFSPEFQKTIYYPEGRYNANHSRVQDEDAVNDLEYLQDKGFFTKLEDFEKRRQEIDAICEKANGLVEDLDKSVPSEWIHSLKTAILIEQHISLGTTDKMEAIFWKDQENLHEYKKVIVRLNERQEKWRRFHPESYESMNGNDLLEHI